ncbi:hypothetical protein GCM10028818_53060 [Spirosoma horti]
MAFKILYIEDQATESRQKDLENLGFEVIPYDPSPNMKEVLSQITPDIRALILDYRLTEGENQAPFDAPTIAQTLRTKHSHESISKIEIPIVLMSNESIITDYYNDFTSQDLFDFVLTKTDFTDNQQRFKAKLISFINSYKTIKDSGYNIRIILGIEAKDEKLIHANIELKAKQFDHRVFEFSRLVFEQIIRSIGPLIGKDILCARLGVSKDSPDWLKLESSLESTKYTGILSDVYPRWWMTKLSDWWSNTLQLSVPIRRLDAEERVELLKTKLNLDLIPITKTKFSKSSNFWTICKYTNVAIDPFDGIELYKKDFLPWQEKEYLSIDATLLNIDRFKDYISEIDRKAIRELAQKINANG